MRRRASPSRHALGARPRPENKKARHSGRAFRKALVELRGGDQDVVRHAAWINSFLMRWTAAGLILSTRAVARMP